MGTLAQQPDKSVWEASENRAEAKAIYRMLGNEKFDREEIARAYREATIRRMAEYGGTILAVQDTTGVNYNPPAGNYKHSAQVLSQTREACLA
jgi:hypothetical protein